MADRSDASPPASILGLLMRAWWMFAGNAALFVVLAMMAIERNDLPSLLDAVFVGLVASLVAARFTDIRYLEGLTPEGARATMGHFRRYAVRLMAGSSAGWGVANSAALL